MAIKMRRGADTDFRPEKMQPGELAVTVDGTRKIYAAFAAGDVKELSSKEDVDKTIASGLESLETSTTNKLQSLEKKASSAVDRISSENHRVQEELSRYEYYTKTESDLKYTVAPRKEASSDTGELKLTDADDGLSYLELQGNSEQYTATGTNLFDVKQLVKNMQEINSKYITIGKDGDGEFMNILNNAWNRLRCLEFTNDPTKSYRIGCKAKYSSGNGNILVFAVMYKDGTYTTSSQVAGQTEYTEMSAIIPAGKEVDYFYFSYSSVGSYYDVLLDSFYLYPEDAPSSEKPTGGYGTPSPEYPSEVRSVGDIPKDVNGVEIRNLLDEEWIKSQPESAWTKAVSGSNTQFRLQLGNEIKKKVTVTAFLKNTIPSEKSFSFTLGNQVGMNGASLVYNNAILKGTADYTAETYVNLYITVNGTTTATHSQMLEVFNYFNFMVTEAAEIDEYRPYIGENNGLVKLESQGKNLFNINQEFKKYNSTMTYTVQGNKIRIKGDWYIYGTINVDKNTVYQLSLNANKPADAGQSVAIFVGVTHVIASVFATPKMKMLFNSGDNRVLNVLLYSGKGTVGEIEYSNIQIEKGDKQTEYQPYYNQITWIPLKEPLRGIRGADTNFYADKIDKNGYVTQNIYFAKGKDMSKFTTDTSGINTSDNPYKWAYWSQGEALWALNSTKNILCNILKRGNFNVNQMVISNTSVIIFNLPNTLTGLANAETDRATISAAIKAWVNTNNPLVYYVLEKPITYQIPAVYIETYDQETNVRCLNKVKPSDMTLDYKIAMSSLIKRLEALETKTVQEV